MNRYVTKINTGSTSYDYCFFSLDVDNRKYMKESSKTLDIPVLFFEAVDGQRVNSINTEIPHVKLLNYNRFLWLHNAKDINKFHCQPPSCDVIGATTSRFSLYNNCYLMTVPILVVYFLMIYVC